MPEEKKKSWFRRHWILSGILGFFALLLVIGIFQGMGKATGDAIKYSDYSQNGLITANSNLLVPQDSETDRIWKISAIESIDANTTGFIEGAERIISKAEDLGGTSVRTTAYRFDSAANAMRFYNQEKQKIDIRGVKEWNLGSNCFGINRESSLAGSAEGVCLRNNVVFYVRSSSVYSYTNYGKDFMNIMLKRI
ncbi:MAG: hypothetical protein Q7R52_03280 [archaeon]|nr:hypothetical protein [archaeon]